MTIDFKNIDQWLFNYYEGNLSPSEVKQLEAFLKKNPELYEDAHAWKDSFVEDAVPAFNPSFLIKEIDTKAERKRFAFAALALLLIGSFSALYLASINNSTTTTSENKNSSEKNFTTNNSKGNSSNVKNIGSSNTVKAINSANHSNANHNGVMAQPSVANYTSTSALVNNNRVNTIPNHVNTHATNLSNTHVNNTLNNNSSSINVTNLSQTTYSGANNTNTGIYLVTQNNNTTIQPNTNLASTNPFEATIQHSNTVELPINEVPVYNQVNTGNFVEQPIVVNEIVESSSESVENINLTVGENDEKSLSSTLNNGQINSGLNPDALNTKTDDKTKTSEIISKDKRNIEMENGIRFGNLRNVSLLQGINNEFESNASFIPQLYRTDGYVGGNYRMLSNSGSTYSSNFIAGYSSTIRKYRTTFNGYTHYKNTDAYKNIGVGLQAAMNLKLDRFNSLIPSISATIDQFKFDERFNTSFNNLNTPIIPASYKSYFGTELTGKQLTQNFVNATHFNLSLGMVYHHKKYYVGASFNGLLQPKFKYTTESSTKQQLAANPATVNLVAGTDFISKKYPEFSVSPQVIVEVHNMEPVITGGTVLKYKTLSAGAGVSTKGAINTYVGFNHRAIGFQYRFMFDKVDSYYGNLTGHYLTTHINIKGLSKKKKAILDDDK